MINNIEFEISPIDEATDAIVDAIKEYFLDDLEGDFISTEIENNISEYLDVLKDGIYCFIEYPYVDKVYRDSFYSYFASKHFSYQRDCIRVSLFNSEISNEDFLDTNKHEELNEKYLGFFIIRPTINSLFGRSLINPDAFVDSDFKICKCVANSLVYGVKFKIEGFPHSSQDEETIKCAETTIWALMEYFSSKYSEYNPTLPSKIHKGLEKLVHQRQLPSLGLTMEQISYSLKEFGFGTKIYSTSQYDNIYNIINCYIESGIPVLLGLESENVGHVTIGIGKEYINDHDFNSIKKSRFHGRGKDISYVDFTDYPVRYVVQDDNLPPYRIIDIDNPGEHYNDDSENPENFKIDSIIVPLYPKIYLESVVAKELFLQIIKDEKIGFDFEDNFTFRYFLASSRSFKNHISKLNKIDGELKYNLLTCKMPKFIWCGEFYPKDVYPKKDVEAIGLVILDATEANKTSIDALLFAAYSDRCINMNENKFVTLQHNLNNYCYFSNLK